MEIPTHRRRIAALTETTMSEENEIDFAKATDAQLAAAQAELKKRRHLTDLEGQDWPNMTETEFAQKKEDVFRAMRQVGKDRSTDKKHAELEARREANA